MMSTLLWGWERFFTERSTFLHTAERQRETANEAYSEYVLQRLQTSLLSLFALMDHLRTGVHVNNQQAVVCAHCYSETAELVVCVREIALQWERHVDEHTMRDMATFYSAGPGYDGVAHSGRPRFNNYNERTD